MVAFVIERGFFIEKYEQQQVCGCPQKKVVELGIGLLERSFLNLQILLQINLQKMVRFKTSGSNCLSDSNGNDAIYLGNSVQRTRKRAGLNAILEYGIFFVYAVGICAGAGVVCS